MPTNTELAKSAVETLINPLMSKADARTEVVRQRRRWVTALVQDAATAGTAVTESVMGIAQGAVRIPFSYVAAPIAVAADNTDYCTFTVSKRTGAGSATSVSSADTRAASLNALAAFVPEALTNSVTAADLELADADVITCKIVKAGSGKAVVAATSYFLFACLVEDI